MIQYDQFVKNPMAILQSRFNIPKDIPQDPNAIIQHLLNTGQISQGQVNQASQMRNNPMIQRMFSNRF